MLVYALVSRGKTVLVENTGSSNTSGNFEVIARVLLGKLEGPDQPARRSVEVEKHTFYVLNEAQGLTFVALADKSFPSRTAFNFLEDVRFRFLAGFKKSDWEHAIAQSYNAEFSTVLSMMMNKYNSDHDFVGRAGDAQLQRVQTQLEEVKDVIKTNIDSLLNRGERLELLVDTTERLTQASIKFQESATRLKNQHWWQSKKNQLTLAGIMLIIVFLILVTSCGGLDFSSC